MPSPSGRGHAATGPAADSAEPVEATPEAAAQAAAEPVVEAPPAPAPEAIAGPAAKATDVGSGSYGYLGERAKEAKAASLPPA